MVDRHLGLAVARSIGAPPDELARESAQEGGILARARAFAVSVDRVLAGKLNPLAVVIENTISPVEAMIDGRPTVLFGTNSYLGLNFHPNCIKAAIEATSHSGTGSTASRVAAGNHRAHLKLESEIADLYGRAAAVVFSTGFMANLGVISALAREEDAIFVDAHCHASIFDACRLSGARVATFAHNDGKDLARLFAESKVPGPRTLVIVEGVYSVRGDVGQLAGIVAAAKRNGAVVMVDEAHAFGIYGGRGRGVAEAQGVEDDIDVIVGTFSKSVGVIGGYAVTSRPELRALRFMTRSFLYTASLPPPVVAAAREAIRLIATEQQLRETVWRNARRMHGGLSALGLDLCAPPGPVGCIRMPGFTAGYGMWKALLDRGIYVNFLVPPATPGGDVVLRFSVSAAHTEAQIDGAITTFREVLGQG
jgi:8-amino-7-oxononanoate synthase